jgi:Domain of unknown function (DUF1918)
MDAAIGDHFVVEGRRVGQTRRDGEVVEVLGSLFSPRPHFRVRWDDGHESPGAKVGRKPVPVTRHR